MPPLLYRVKVDIEVEVDDYEGNAQDATDAVTLVKDMLENDYTAKIISYRIEGVEALARDS